MKHKLQQMSNNSKSFKCNNNKNKMIILINLINLFKTEKKIIYNKATNKLKKNKNKTKILIIVQHILKNLNIIIVFFIDLLIAEIAVQNNMGKNLVKQLIYMKLKIQKDFLKIQIVTK